MGRNQLKIESAIKSMWTFAMFDLPVLTKTDKNNYAHFRKLLLAEGFLKMQFSVYARYCETRENMTVILRRIKKGIPPAGQVRFLSVTDKQFSDMTVYNGQKTENPEKKPQQMMLF